MAKWTVDPRRFIEQAQVTTRRAVQLITHDLFYRIVVKSPIDTGQFVSNWRVTLGGTIGGLPKFEPITRSGTNPLSGADRALYEVNKVLSNTYGARAANAKGNTIWLSNAAPYAYRLEHGWSKQAPTGMVRVSFAEVTARLA